MLSSFYSALNKCKVIIKDCKSNVEEQLEIDSIEQEQFFGKLSLGPVAKSNATNKTNKPHKKLVRLISQPKIIPQSPTRELKVIRNSRFISEPDNKIEDDSPELEFSVLTENVQVAPELVSRKLRTTRKLRSSTSG